MSTRQVLIVGAGPTGLVLALRLARHGVPFRIIDRSGGPGLASRAMAVQARTLELYQQLGIADEMVAGGVKIETVHLREGGEEAARLSLMDIGEGLSPYPFALAYPQDDHERFLVAKLGAVGVAVEWGVELKRFRQDHAGVHAVLEREGMEEACEAAYLCGCDGAHSRVREGLGLEFAGGTYQQLFYVADVEIRGEFQRDLFVNLGARSLGLLFPVRSSGMQRLIGLVPQELSHRDDLTFEDIRASVEPLLGIRVETVSWFSTYHVHHRVAERFADGRCFIAGDAGHIHSPAGGQGMNTGIGDAVNLSWKLAHVLQDRADPSLLGTYESERIGFARTLVATTDRAFQALVGEGGGSRLLRTWLMPHLVPFLTGFSAVRRVMFNTISQVRIAYHDSALSVGRAGDVEGGDRLPWVPLSDGDNFAPLRSLDWQLHVYGDPSPALLGTAAALGLPLHAFAWNGAAEEAGLRRDAAYLVRPDGYVAKAAPDPAAIDLAGFAREFGLKLGPAAEP